MKQKLLNSIRLRVCMLVAVMCAAFAGQAWATVTNGDVFERISSVGDLADGDEIIFVNQAETYACGTTQNTNNRTPVAISVSDHKYTYASKDNVQVFVVKISRGLGVAPDNYGFHTGSGYIYSASSGSNYLKTNSTAASTAPSGTSAWTLSVSSYVFSATNSSNTSYYLAFNGTSYFSQYKTGQSKPYIFKKQATVATALSVKTAPTKLNYKKGETLDLTGLVLDATVGGNHVDVTSGYTASPANGATLNSVGAQTVTFTYGGQNTTQTIHVGDLKSIALNTTGVKTTYDEGQTFDPENLVVTATYSDGETTPTEWTEGVDLGDCTFDPDGALETTDDNVTVSYTLGSTTKTADIGITVNAASAYTVTFNAGTGSCGTSSLTEASAKAGVTLPSATIGVAGWSFAGWATASTASTEVEPTLYAAGATYNPTEDCTLYAVYSYSEVSTTTYKRATSLSDITSADKIVIAYNDGKVLNTSINLSTTLVETSGKVTPASNAIFTLSGDNTNGYTLTNSTNTIGATGTGSSLTIALSGTNNLWTFSASTYGSNHFNVNNKGASGKSLEVYNSAWKAYALTASDQAWAMRIYVPADITVYNSNPAAIINPTVAFTNDGDKTLYVHNTNTYDNAANVTGIAKTPVYTSSDVTVATVSEAGVVTALKAGETTIKATVVAETGVNTKAEASYVVTVKDASDIAGIKAITSSSSVVTFIADLTDAVVTYVNGNHAYIQDASGAIYASCGSSLTAGKKINGAVSGSVKAANQIDEITAIDLSGATVTDGVVPSAAVISAATLAANTAYYEGKLVSIAGATVTASLANGSASGGKISDDGKTTEINLYAPDSNIDALKDAEGTFNGYISIYNGSTIRFNIYEQSQITLTKNAPTDQSLSFDSDAVELDVETSAYDAFDGQAVSGAVGDVTYTIDSDESSVVTSIDSETGAVVLSGNIGTATIKASAAAKEVTEAGVTTPYKATTKTYTITVYPRFTVTFSANGVETPVRQASHGAAVAVPSPGDLSGFNFMGWSENTVDLRDDAPSMVSLGATVTPEADATYYAVFAVQGIGEDEDFEFYKNTGSAETDATSGITAAGNINTTSSNGNPGDSFGLTSQSNKTATFTGIDISKEKSASLKLDYKLAKSGSNYSSLAVTQYDSEDNVLGSPTEITGSDQVYHTSGTIALNTACVKITIVCSPAGSTYNTFVDNVIITVPRPSVSYGSYCTTVPAHVNISSTVGYTTYVATDNVSFPGDVTAYIATQVNAETISLEEVLAVPEGTAVVVKGDKGVYMLDVEDAGDCDDVSSNLLEASDGSVIGDGSTIFALGVGKKDPYVGQVGFYLVKEEVAVPAGKAYLTVLTVPASVKEFLTFDFDDATAIAKIQDSGSKIQDSEIFNLAGQKMSKLQKGVNIVNGKKVLVK